MITEIIALWHQYKWYFWGSLAMVSLLVGLLFAVMIQNQQINFQYFQN